MTERRPYHHGDLRRALLSAAVTAIGESGPAALSLRELARRAGVSHAAPAHHFGDKAGLLAALAAEGYEMLADVLVAARERSGDFIEVGVAYVRFGIDHRAHFEVMFQPNLYDWNTPQVVAARQRAGAELEEGLAMLPKAPPADEARRTALAAWSIAHGFATLWLGGALPAELGDDPGAAARSVIRLLFD